MSLSEALSEPGTRSRLVDDCCLFVDREVSKKTGLTGVLVRAAYGAVRSIKPGFVREVIESLFDEWAQKLDAIWVEAAQSQAPENHFAAERSRVADALLSVTDAKSKHAKNKLVRTTYEKLRPAAKKHVEQAVPGLAELLKKYAR